MVQSEAAYGDRNNVKVQCYPTDHLRARNYTHGRNDTANTARAELIRNVMDQDQKKVAFIPTRSKQHRAPQTSCAKVKVVEQRSILNVCDDRQHTRDTSLS